MKFILVFLCLFCSTEARGWTRNHHAAKPVILETILVDLNGRGNFTSIQAAIDSVPHDRRHPRWISIRVAPGVYRERVTVNKPYLFLKGSGRGRTKVVYNDAPNSQLSATLVVVVDNFVAKGMSFVNSRNLPEYGGNLNERQPAAAAYIMGDRCSFHRCGFYGVQDTLWDVQGRHYFHQTTIVGSVDFILGAGQSIYEKCLINVLGGVLSSGTIGFITAQARGSPYETSGFVFKDCSIIGGSQAYLGRPWGPYARVLFYNTTMSDVIVPQGWDTWVSRGREDKITFAEDKCEGPGAHTWGRVPWAKKLSVKEIQELTSLDYIDSDKWIDAQPINFK